VNRKWFLLCLAGLLLYTNPVWATPFPDKTSEVVQDEDGYLKARDRESFAEALKKVPGNYKVVVVESTQPETPTPDEYAQRLYDNYNLSEDTLMIVLDINTEQLGVYAGPALQANGVTPELLHEKMAAFYEPYRNQKEYLKGIQLFITEVYNEWNGAQNGSKATAAEPAAMPQEQEEQRPKSVWAAIPWWLYLIGLSFAGVVATLVYAMFRRRAVFAQVDEIEAWKDELVEKINVIEVDKSLRRASGATEERFLQLANRKENMLRIRIPEVEMTILDAEEACDRFRFRLALGLLSEAREMLSGIESELDEWKADAVKVTAVKKENKVAIPEIGKQFEQVERRLSELRLEYGLSFHELKAGLDEVESMRKQVKEALAAGDDVQAYDTTLKAQQLLGKLSAALEQIPPLVRQVLHEMPEEFKQLEEGIAQAIGDGYDLNEHALEGSLLQAKQLINAAKTALGEGSLELVQTHVKAYEVLLDATYQNIEDTVLAQRQAAAAQALAVKQDMAAVAVEESEDAYGSTVLHDAPLAENTAVAEQPEAEGAAVTVELPDEDEGKVAAVDRDVDEMFAEPEAATAEPQSVPLTAGSMSEAEREVLLDMSGSAAATAVMEPEKTEDDVEYELVIPKQQVEPELDEAVPERLVITCEDDALDELERISNALVRIRQQIKRSYLPGIPDRLKYLFEESVQLLAQAKATMEQYRYDLEEVSILLNEAHELLMETERLTEKTISACQLAEGAIQYTNRYRRQNRQVNELLGKAEHAFRQLSFDEAYQLAEEARLVVERAPEETDKRWLLRRKKKG
jgi:septation ring formation regulator